MYYLCNIYVLFELEKRARAQKVPIDRWNLNFIWRHGAGHLA